MLKIKRFYDRLLHVSGFLIPILIGGETTTLEVTEAPKFKSIMTVFFTAWVGLLHSMKYSMQNIKPIE